MRRALVRSAGLICGSLEARAHHFGARSLRRAFRDSRTSRRESLLGRDQPPVDSIGVARVEVHVTREGPVLPDPIGPIGGRPVGRALHWGMQHLLQSEIMLQFRILGPSGQTTNGARWLRVAMLRKRDAGDRLTMFAHSREERIAR